MLLTKSTKRWALLNDAIAKTHACQILKPMFPYFEYRKVDITQWCGSYNWCVLNFETNAPN
jgi:hypothetical protein